jgi:hypothetical protein
MGEIHGRTGVLAPCPYALPAGLVAGREFPVEARALDRERRARIGAALIVTVAVFASGTHRRLDLVHRTACLLGDASHRIDPDHGFILTPSSRSRTGRRRGTPDGGP